MQPVNKTKNFLRPSTSGYLNHIKWVAERMTEIMQPYKISVVAPGGKPVQSYETLRLLNEGRHVDGMLTESHMKCLEQLLGIFIKRSNVPSERGSLYFDDNFVALSALCQTGKTTIISLISLVFPIVRNILTDEDSTTIRLLINDKGLETQADISGKNFFDMYQNLEFSSIPPKEENPESTPFQYNQELIERHTKKVDLNGIGFRTSKSKLPSIAEFESNCRDSNINQIVVLDEADARVKTDSVLYQINQKVESLFKCAVAMSATNDAARIYCHERGLPVAYMLPDGVVFTDEYKETNKQFPNSSYTGLGWLDERKLLGVIPQQFSSIRSIDSLCGTNLAQYSPRDIFDKDSWKVIQDAEWELVEDDFNHPHPLDWEDAKAKFIGDVCIVVKKYLAKNNELGSTGMLGRILVNNGKMNEIASVMRSKMPGIHVVVHAEECESTIKNRLIEECGPEGNRTKPYFLIVTGRGRRGDNVPADCKYGIEFAGKSIPTALMQGVVGRLHGYFKGTTMVMLSDHNFDLMKNYAKHGRWLVTRKDKLVPVSPNQLHISTKSDLSYAINTNELPIHLRKQLSNLAALDAELTDAKNETESGQKIKRLHKVSGKEWFTLWNKIADYVDAKISKGNQNVRVLRTDKDGNTVLNSVQIRSDGNKSKTNSNATKNRDSLGDNRPQPSLIVDRHMNPTTVRLRLQSHRITHTLTKRNMFGAKLTQEL